MKERLPNIEIGENKVKVEAALAQVDIFSNRIALNMGEQWERDRFGKYKSEHMIHMAEESEKIIKDYELDKNSELREYLPVFKFICRAHDLGRHFHDDKNFVDEKGKFLDHGEISVRLLRGEGVLDNFSENEQKLIEYVIRNHSIQEMTQPIDEVEKKAQSFCSVFRDMDKLEVLNKRDFVKAAEIYRLVGIHFDLGDEEEKWKTTLEKEKYIGMIQDILGAKNVETSNDRLSGKIEEIMNSPLQEEIGEDNIVELFESKKTMSMNVYRETNSYSNYLLYLLAFLNDIKCQKTINKVSSEEIQMKMNFLKPRCTDQQYSRIQNALLNNFGIKVN